MPAVLLQVTITNKRLKHALICYLLTYVGNNCIDLKAANNIEVVKELIDRGVNVGQSEKTGDYYHYQNQRLK